MNELALFAGAGGGILGGVVLGWRTVAAVEIEEYPRAVLLQRQADGILPRFPVWDDVRTFDGKPWRGRVDVITGGFPCVDISCAGKGAGITGEHSGLWTEMARIIGEVRPRYCFVENSPMLVCRGLDVVLSDLAQMGYDAEWGVIGAHHVGAPHKRDRIWIVATDTKSGGRFRQGGTCAKNRGWENEKEVWGSVQYIACDNGLSELVADTTGGECKQQQTERQGGQDTGGGSEETRIRTDWPTEPDICRVVNGMAFRVDRLKAIGNGQVSRVAATAWNILIDRICQPSDAQSVR